VKQERPVDLNPFGYKYPITAIASITHRITGVLLFPSIAYLLWLLALALGSPEGFERGKAILEAPVPKVVLLLVLVSLAYHLFAGMKHLVMDFHYWDNLRAAHYSSIGVMVLTGVSAILIVLWL
jgi:succinate dehydrogenase / fumarate reductase, cytochrome b subunit